MVCLQEAEHPNHLLLQCFEAGRLWDSFLNISSIVTASIMDELLTWDGKGVASLSPSDYHVGHLEGK